MSDYFGSRGSFRSRNPREDVDPMSSMSGIGDIMLVFACGLMTALVVAWNVNLSEFQQVNVGEEIENVQDFNGEDVGGASATYIEKGVVYQDAETGQYYLMEQPVDTGLDNEAEAGEAAGEGTGTAEGK